MSARDVRDILLAPRLERQVVRELLGPYGFADPEGADRNLQDVARDPQTRGRLAEVLPALLESLGRSADPDGALLRLERFLRASLSPGQVLSALQERPPAMDVLATTFGASPFMAEILIRNPAWFHWLSDPSVLGRARTSEEIEDDLDAALAPLQHRERQLDALRVAKRREILHVGARDLMRLAEVEETVTALSHLAEALIQKSYELAERWFREQRGLPPLAPEKARARGGFTVLGMGKLGGGELNFSSDVDLVFLGESDRGRLGRSGRAPSRIEHAEAVARNVTAALAEPTAEGTVYRVDLRLRPEGAAGGLVHSLSRFDEYYRSRGTTWERFALLRAWPVAGDVPLGLRFLKRVRPFVFG
ncbi:MAG TPA: glutamate-ammonia-ligase adenylyltransferase, partial [Vicinamibacteria bacterium]